MDQIATIHIQFTIVYYLVCIYFEQREASKHSLYIPNKANMDKRNLQRGNKPEEGVNKNNNQKN